MKIKSTVFSILLFCVVVASSAQTFIVFSTHGNVRRVQNGKQYALAVRDTVKGADILDIPMKAGLVLINEQDGVQISLSKPGRASAKSMAMADKNSVRRISAKYLAYIRSQLVGMEYRQVRNCSDPAAVTRALKIVGEEQDTEAYEDFRVAYNSETDKTSLSLDEAWEAARRKLHESFEREREQMYNEFEDFRRQSMDELLSFMSDPWEEMEVAENARPKKEKTVPPVTVPKDLPEKPLKDKAITVSHVFKQQTIPSQPLPPGRIREVDDRECQMVPFSFYGTEDQVRFNTQKAPHLKKLTETDVASFLKSLMATRYDNLLVDCLTLRTKYQLSDWAYLQMLKSLSAACYGADTNEAVLLMAYLYCQSGYKMRLGHDTNKIYMLYASNFHVYDQVYINIDGDKYYGVEPLPNRLFACRAKYPREEQLSFNLTKNQMFTINPTERRTIVSETYPNVKIESVVNQNLLDFYTNYPVSYDGKDMMSRWALCANAPLQTELSEMIYPQLRQCLQGLSQYDQVERILNLLQTGLSYAYDEEVWGEDRAFFSEESLFYPGCDCEDRSILLTRMVRDLLGLKCLLVHYPGHLATAIHFDEDVKGDYILYNDEKYVVCDPTYLKAHVGMTMPDMDNQEAEIILLNATQPMAQQ